MLEEFIVIGGLSSPQYLYWKMCTHSFHAGRTIIVTVFAIFVWTRKYISMREKWNICRSFQKLFHSCVYFIFLHVHAKIFTHTLSNGKHENIWILFDDIKNIEYEKVIIWKIKKNVNSIVCKWWNFASNNFFCFLFFLGLN